MLVLWIINDNPFQLHSLVEAFQGLCELRIFMDPRESLKAIKDETIKRPDVILADYEMQGMDGLEMLGKILMFNPKINAYLFSSVLSDEIIDRARSAGVKMCLAKPVDMIALKRLILG